MTNLEKYLYQLRRIEAHRTVEAEKEIRKIYKKLLKEMQNYLAEIYTKHSEDDVLSYAGLARAGMEARFLEEVELRINGITPEVAGMINTTVSQTYEACYTGMQAAVVKAAGNRQALIAAFATVAAVTPDVINRAVNNPVSGLTLKDTLEKHRKEIIYDIKKNIGVGLANGDRFTTMAGRISESLDGDYRKSIRIVRTEAHRVRESGYCDAATDLDNALRNANTGYVMAKTWRTMNDERVRPAKAKGKARQYNHIKMDGVTIPQNELFELPSGATCICPSQTGVAGEDINCRCYVSYDLVLASELTKVQDGEKTIDEAAKAKPKKDILENYNISEDFSEEEKAALRDGIEYIEGVFGKQVRNYVNTISKNNPLNYKAYEAYYDRATKGIYFDKKLDEIYDTLVVHEFTHAIQDEMKRKRLALGYTQKSYIPDELRKEIFKANGVKFTKANATFYVSEYASQNSDEFISECVANSMYPTKRNKEFLEIALRIIKGKHEMLKMTL